MWALFACTSRDRPELEGAEISLLEKHLPIFPGLSKIISQLTRAWRFSTTEGLPTKRKKKIIQQVLRDETNCDINGCNLLQSSGLIPNVIHFCFRLHDFFVTSSLRKKSSEFSIFVWLSQFCCQEKANRRLTSLISSILKFNWSWQFMSEMSPFWRQSQIKLCFI